jgi:predicted DNA-binding protein with PD1-like motif
VRAGEVTTGRTFVVAFDHGEDFYPTLQTFCKEHGLRQGYIPMFIAGLSVAEVVGTCERLEDPAAPVWSRVHLRNVEALGGGTLALDPATGDVLPHIHVSVGLKEHSATAHTSHLLAATVQFLVEMVIVEVTAPTLTRTRQPDLYDVPLLGFPSPAARPSE